MRAFWLALQAALALEERFVEDAQKEKMATQMLKRLLFGLQVRYFEAWARLTAHSRQVSHEEAQLAARVEMEREREELLKAQYQAKTELDAKMAHVLARQSDVSFAPDSRILTPPPPGLPLAPGLPLVPHTAAYI